MTVVLVAAWVGLDASVDNDRIDRVVVLIMMKSLVKVSLHIQFGSTRTPGWHMFLMVFCDVPIINRVNVHRLI